jgi:hypothetical protein
MIKNRSAKILAVAVGAVLILWAGLVFAGGKAVKVPFTATETVVALIDPGTMTYPDGNYHVRDQVVQFNWFSSDDDRLIGVTIVVINRNLDSPPDPNGPISSGPMWGTFKFTADPNKYEDSGWDGSWHGEVFDQVKNIAEHSGVGHGYGQFEGLQMTYSCTYTGTPIYQAACTGRILETNRK